MNEPYALANLPAPTLQLPVHFRNAGTEYVLKPDGDRWSVHRLNHRTSTEIITLEQLQDGSWLGVSSESDSTKYFGATRQDVLRQVL
ncbi:hypothetical protein [Microbacterium sp.]|uniref:hypothetical protein n=1 Tax=Microbacterium sp. TaxID=51671 RepID=UPI0039E2FF02